MVQFPGYYSMRLCIQRTVTGIPTGWVTPFGHLWITGCLLLPTAFRSLPRPSSSDSSKASTVDPCSLDHIILFPSLFGTYVKEHAVESDAFSPRRQEEQYIGFAGMYQE